MIFRCVSTLFTHTRTYEPPQTFLSTTDTTKLKTFAVKCTNTATVLVDYLWWSDCNSRTTTTGAHSLIHPVHVRHLRLLASNAVHKRGMGEEESLLGIPDCWFMMLRKQLWRSRLRVTAGFFFLIHQHKYHNRPNRHHNNSLNNTKQSRVYNYRILNITSVFPYSFMRLFNIWQKVEYFSVSYSRRRNH